MMWTPYQIEIILHHHCSSSDFERDSAPMYHPTVAELIKDGVLIRKDGCLRTTELGEALINMWCKTPLPVRAYIDPREMENQNDSSSAWLNRLRPHD